MRKYKEKILDESIWLSATPASPAYSLPFYVMEAGHFIAERGYAIKRESHDSFLLLYTISGTGTVCTNNSTFSLQSGRCIIIDCHLPHEYFCAEDSWEFIWFHFNGNNMEKMFNLLYSGDVHPAVISNSSIFLSHLFSLLDIIKENNIRDFMDISAAFHSIFNDVYKSAILIDDEQAVSAHTDKINIVIEYIKNNYSSQITIDDMIKQIHISKYHFIRIFKRMSGITPYSYLTNYRINKSKLLLRSSDMSISEISEKCGFLDDSNFIYQFKKHTGQTPRQYRLDFSVLTLK